MPNALPGHVEPFPHFLQGQGMPGLQTKTQNDDLTLPWIQPLKHAVNLLPQKKTLCLILCGGIGVICHKIPQIGAFLVTYRGLQGYGISRCLNQLRHSFPGHVYFLSHFLHRRFTSQLHRQAALGTADFIYCLHHVDRKPDGPGLVRQGPGNGLLHPPCGIGAEPVTFGIVKLFHCFHKPQIPLLNQVQKTHTPAGIAFGNADHQAQVSLHQLAARFHITF